MRPTGKSSTFPMSTSTSKLSGAPPRSRWLSSAEPSSATRRSSTPTRHSSISRDTTKIVTRMSMLNSLLPSVLAIRTKSAPEMPLQLGMYRYRIGIDCAFSTYLFLKYFTSLLFSFVSVSDGFLCEFVNQDPTYLFGSGSGFFCNVNGSVIVIRIRRIQHELQYVWPNLGGGRSTETVYTLLFFKGTVV